MLNAVVTDINAVDEAHRGFYKEADGKFVLQVTAADGFSLENTSGLKSALTTERATREELERKLKPYEGLDVNAARQAMNAIGLYGDITPQKAKEALETAARLSAIDPAKEADRLAEEKANTVKTQLTEAFSAREKELQTQVEAATQTVGTLKNQLQTLMVDNVITAELAKLNPLDDARDALVLMAKQSIRTREVDGKIVVEVVDANGNAIIKSVENGVVQNMSVADLLAGYRETKAALFKADQKQGLGVPPGAAQGSGSSAQVNPWKKETFNMTQQGVLMNTNPELAKRLKAEAGK